MIYRILDVETSCRITDLRKRVSFVCDWKHWYAFACYTNGDASFIAVEYFYVNQKSKESLSELFWTTLIEIPVIWHVMSCQLLNSYWSLQDCCTLIMEAVRPFETSNYLPSTRRNIPKHLQRHNIAVKTSDFAELIKPNVLVWSECYCDLQNESGWLELANDALCSPVFQYVIFYWTAILKRLVCFIFQSVIQANMINRTALPLLYTHNWGLG